MNMKLALNSWLAALAASIGLGGSAGMSHADPSRLAGAGIGGISGTLFPEASVSRTFGDAAAGGLIGHLMTPKKGVRANIPFSGNGHHKGRRSGYSRRWRQNDGSSYSFCSTYTSGDRYHSTSNEWLGS